MAAAVEPSNTPSTAPDVSFSKALRALREAADYSRNDWSEVLYAKATQLYRQKRVGVRRNMIELWEHGRAVPLRRSLNVIVAVCEDLDLFAITTLKF
jgi:transcriptional regulator with XRE-family HTH domain